jgi:flagellar protein FlaD
MPEDEEDSEKMESEEFDLSTELSALVEQNIIPSRVAKRLDQKLKEKNVSINREQLQIIIEKIRDIMRAYARTKHLNVPLQNEKLPSEKSSDQPSDQKAEDSISEIVDAIGSMQDDLKTIEKGSLNKNDILSIIHSLQDNLRYVGSDDASRDDIINAISSLQDSLKSMDKGKTSKQKIVTTEDIQVPKTMALTDRELSFDPLAEIPSDPESVVVLMKWLQYLIDRCGRPNLSNILDYYVDIGWLSEDAKINLIDYSQGIKEEKKGGEPAKKGVTDLPSKDHIQSLIFIQKLKGRKLDKHFIERVDNEISRIFRKLDNYN